MGNDKDTTVALLAAAARAGEKLWEMPLEPRYKALVESDVADLRNIATNRYGGSTHRRALPPTLRQRHPLGTHGYCRHRIRRTPMASYIGKGGTGYGVRTLVEYIENFSKSV